MRIVIATGDNDLRLAIQLILSEEPGINIIGSASDCDGLLALVRSTHPEVVLLDWELPGCKMEDTLQQIKSIQTEANTFLIVLGRKSKMKENALETGADAFRVIGDPPENLLDAFRQLNIK